MDCSNPLPLEHCGPMLALRRLSIKSSLSELLTQVGGKATFSIAAMFPWETLKQWCLDARVGQQLRSINDYLLSQIVRVECPPMRDETLWFRPRTTVKRPSICFLKLYVSHLSSLVLPQSLK